MKTIITADSSCDLTKEQLEKFGIKIIPIYVTMNGEEYKDGINVTPNDIFNYVKQTKTLPKTAALSVADFSTFFKQILDENKDSKIIHISLSSGLSSCYEHAHIAALELDDKVTVIDGKSLSTGTGLLVIHAAKLAKNNVDHLDIIKSVQSRIANVQASFIIPEVEYLYKGGRCSAIALLGANLLKIKPKIQVIDGKMKNVGKPRGKMNVVLKNYVDEVLSEYNNPDKSICFVTHSCIDDETLNEITEYVKSKNIFDEVVTSIASSTITCHCGKGTLGILYINDGGEK